MTHLTLHDNKTKISSGNFEQNYSTYYLLLKTIKQTNKNYPLTLTSLKEAKATTNTKLLILIDQQDVPGVAREISCVKQSKFHLANPFNVCFQFTLITLPNFVLIHFKNQIVSSTFFPFSTQNNYCLLLFLPQWRRSTAP